MSLTLSFVQSMPAVMPAVDNPLNGVVPDFNVFGADFTTVWQKLAAGLWGLAILITIFFFGRSLVSVAQARQASHPAALEGAKKDAAVSGLALGGLVAFGALVSAVLLVFNV